MVKTGKRGSAPPPEPVTPVLVHPSLSPLSRDPQGCATGAVRAEGDLRAPVNLRDERDILRFGIGLFSGLSVLEAEGWPSKPSPSRWAVAEDGLPVLSERGEESPAGSLAESHAALLHRLLTGKCAAPRAPWGAVPRRHKHGAAWNAWFASLRGEGAAPSCRACLLGLWSLAERTGCETRMPSSWGVAATWTGAPPSGGWQILQAHGAHALQAALAFLGRWARPVALGGTPPYPYAALEPVIGAALRNGKPQAWLGERLGAGEKALAKALRQLLSDGELGWVLHPATALDRESLRVLSLAAEGMEAPVILLDDAQSESSPAVRAVRVRLPWFTPVAEAWTLEHARALMGEEREAWLTAFEGAPLGQPRCGGSLVPPLPTNGPSSPRAFLGTRQGGATGGDPESAARGGRLAELAIMARAMEDSGNPAGRRFWEGALLALVGQPKLALTEWEGLDASFEDRGRLNLYRARAFERLQDYEGARSALREARGRTLSPEDGRVADLLEAQLLWLDGREEEAGHLLRPLAAGTAVGDARAQALCHLATQALHANRLEDAMRCVEAARAALPERPEPLSEFLVLHRTGMALRKVGDFGQALDHFEASRKVAAGVGFRALEAWSDCERGTALRQLFRFDEAMAAYRRAEEGAAGLGLEGLAGSARFGLAICQVEAGALGPAERTFLASTEGDGAPVHLATAWYWIASVRQQRGDYPGALSAAETGLAALEGFEDPEVRLPLLVLRGEILLMTGQLRKLTHLLRDLDAAILPETEPNDRLAACALKRAAAAKGEGAFSAADGRRAQALLGEASPYFRAHWHLHGALAEREDPVRALDQAWRSASEARSPHLASRALWALAEREALPALDPETRRWLSAFLADNRVRGPEAGLLRFLGEASYIPESAEIPLPPALEFLARAEAHAGDGLEEILDLLGASCGCLTAPGRGPHWWGTGTAEQRRALASAAGLSGETPGPGGRILGHQGTQGVWCGVLRPGASPFAAEPAALFRVWAKLASFPEEERVEPAARPVHPAVARLLLTRSPAMTDLLGKIGRAAPFAFPVLITGEPGSGKEVCARAIHEASPRAGKPWVPANCANLSPTLAASQLFGHRKGAFTGADRDQVGFVETARGGTLFLDEVGEIPLEVQPGLLRYLQDGSYTPLGESRERRSDARIVAATNRDLERAVAEGRFRPDLYHRLRVIPIEVPPLRRRPEDIPLLFDHFLEKAAREEGVQKPDVDFAVLTRLAASPWPGNVRELQNLARALLVEAQGGPIREDHLPARTRHPGDGSPRSLAARLAFAEREAIEEALLESGGNATAAARLLGVSRQALAQKVKRLGIGRP